MGERFAALLCAALLVGAALSAPAGSSAVAGSEAGDGQSAVRTALSPAEGASALQTQTIERDSVLLHVDVYPNGTARWRVEYRTRLDDPATEGAFRSLQESIRENPDNYSASFFERIRAAIASAENATGREMAGEDFGVHTEVRHIPQAYGIVVYSYTWRGFAATSGNRLVAGDALSGLFLNENERLLLSWPAGYELADVTPPADTRRDNAVVWEGPTEFGPTEPRAVLAERPGLVERFGPVTAGALALLAAVAAFAWGVRRRYGDAVATGLGDRDGESDETLLSNEERVVRLLERRGGRMKQQDVIDELGWTEAKTSQVVTDLREQGRIESFRLGRENVLSLSEPARDRGPAEGID